ncbi:MAG TPA: Rieske 2Fe-2S domain-containing protein [Gemmatimonadaceae bacterium]|nr:Rieske 2Fe-2S domain-containing protein [Gemmatimonadaceae bacterium]
MEHGVHHDVIVDARTPTAAGRGFMFCKDCLNRRDFLAKSALVAATLVLAEDCGDGQIGPPIPKTTPGVDPTIPTSAGVTVNVADFPGFSTFGTIVDLADERAAVRTSATTFVGFSKLCTHQQCETEVRDNQFQCPCHGSIFAADGAVIRGPDVQNNGITPLHQLATTFDSVKGTLTVA